MPVINQYLLIAWYVLIAVQIVRAIIAKKKDSDIVKLEWVTLAVTAVSLGIKYVVPLFRRKKYTPGGYELGAMYRRNVLGENFPNTDDDRKVGDAAAYLARYIFTAGFGIIVPNRAWYHIYILKGDYNGYAKKCKDDYGITVNRQAFDRAHFLAKTYFPDQAAPPQFVWDLTKFDTVPYVTKIPDANDPKKPMTVNIEGSLVVADGVIIRPNPTQLAAVDAAQNAPGQDLGPGSKNTLLLLGAAAAVGGLWYFSKKKKTA